MRSIESAPDIGIHGSDIRCIARLDSITQKQYSPIHPAVQCSLHQSPSCLFAEIDKLTLKFIQKCRLSKAILREGKVGDAHVLTSELATKL